MAISKKVSQNKYILITVIILAIGIIAALFVLTKNKKPTTAQDTVVVSADQPSEKKPQDEGYVWNGGADDPKKIRISSIDLDGYVQKVGIDKNNRVAAPNNIYLAGWFVDSKKPGEDGLSIIDGHYDGIQSGSKGIFYRLTELKKTDTFEVELGSSQIKKYEIISVDTLDTDKTAAVLFSQDPMVKSQLNLITCSGDYDTSAKSYNKRTVVSAKLIQ